MFHNLRPASLQSTMAKNYLLPQYLHSKCCFVSNLTRTMR